MSDFIRYFGKEWNTIWQLTVEHLNLTLLAVILAIIVGVPLGILLTRHRFLASPVLSLAGVIQTVPSLALLGFLIPLMGIGAKPAILALFLYALLPIVRNSYVGIDNVDPPIIEAGRGMGLTDLQILFRVELPLALPVIMAGIRTSTIINVGMATLCALIGAGGLGQMIFRGISMVNSSMILAGAVPAAILALALDFLLGLAEKLLSPRGLKANT